jgi:hypothetical protein
MISHFYRFRPARAVLDKYEDRTSKQRLQDRLKPWKSWKIIKM